MISTLSSEELYNYIHSHTDILIVDVRTTQEYSREHITTSINIPLHILPLRIGELDTTRKIIYVCQSGGRSSQAAFYSMNAGLESYTLLGGIQEFSEKYKNHIFTKKG